MSDGNDSVERKNPGERIPGVESGACTENSYKVGYKRPPRKSQFRPGRSGNPKGRVTGSRNAKTVVSQVANRPIRVRKNGKVEKVTTFEAMLEGVAMKALQGDFKAFNAFTALMCRTGALNEVDDSASATSLPDADNAIIEDYLRRRGGGVNERDDSQ